MSMSAGLSSPADDYVPATKSDSVDEAFVSRGFYVEAAGNVKVTTKAGNARTIAVVANQFVPLRVRRVWSTGTTVTGTIHLAR